MLASLRDTRDVMVIQRVMAPRVLIAFCLGVLLLNSTFSALDSCGYGPGPPGDPYPGYTDDPGIRDISVLALVANLLLALAVVARSRQWRGRRIALGVIVLCCLIGIALPWIELWWGSTLRYPNRDKQNLPLSTANLGPFGVTLYCMYLANLLRLPVKGPVLRAVACLLIISTVGIVTWLVQMRVLELVEEPWSLWSS